MKKVFDTKKSKQNFFDEDIGIDKSLFVELKISDIVCWSQLELYCVVRGTTIDSKFFRGIVCGTELIGKLYDLVLDAIENSDVVDQYLDADLIELIEKVYSPLSESRTYAAKEFWLDVAFNEDQLSYNNYHSSGIVETNTKKYTLLSAIFKKSPYAILKFFDKRCFVLHQYDEPFERWLLNKCMKKAVSDKLFLKITAALKKQVDKMNNISMHMN